jgi:hypothetical protein
MDESYDSYWWSSTCAGSAARTRVPVGYLTFEELFYAALRSAARRRIPELAAGVPNEFADSYARQHLSRGYKRAQAAANQERLDRLIDQVWQGKIRLAWLRRTLTSPPSSYRVGHPADDGLLERTANNVALRAEQVDEILSQTLRTSWDTANGPSIDSAKLDELEEGSASAIRSVGDWFKVLTDFYSYE